MMPPIIAKILVVAGAIATGYWMYTINLWLLVLWILIVILGLSVLFGDKENGKS